MSNLVYLLVVLVCPLMMFFMMRGMHGGREEHVDGGQRQRPDDLASRGADPRDARLADLEREVRHLREAQKPTSSEQG